LARSREGDMVLKISGVPERAVGSNRQYDNWSVKQVQPFLSAAVAAFGPERCIYGSNLFVLDTFSSAIHWTAGLATMLDAGEQGYCGCRPFCMCAFMLCSADVPLLHVCISCCVVNTLQWANKHGQPLTMLPQQSQLMSLATH